MEIIQIKFLTNKIHTEYLPLINYLNNLQFQSDIFSLRRKPMDLLYQVYIAIKYDPNQIPIHRIP
jgi:hypothetical protein